MPRKISLDKEDCLEILNLSEPFIIISPGDLSVIELNTPCIDFFHIEEDISGESLESLLCSRYLGNFYNQISGKEETLAEVCANAGKVPQELLGYITLDNNKYYIKIAAASFHNNEYVLLKIVDYSASLYDHLTGLYNRQVFEDVGNMELREAMRYGNPMTVLMLDADRFKKINDLLGHLAGDYVLKCIASCCTDTVREADILSRYGGDEFAILFPQTKMADALIIADRLKQSITEADFVYRDNTIKVTVSMGLRSLTQKVTEFDQLLIRADKALYKAKSGGGNKIFYYEKSRFRRHK
jgi:diguanylate cyclase (GGDEF)-like protein